MTFGNILKALIKAIHMYIEQYEPFRFWLVFLTTWLLGIVCILYTYIHKTYNFFFYTSTNKNRDCNKKCANL